MKAHAKNSTAAPSALPGEKRVQALDWEQISHELDAQGSAVLERLISPDHCQRLAVLYGQNEMTTLSPTIINRKEAKPEPWRNNNF